VSLSFFEQLGGEQQLRAIIDDFLERVFADPMIGFFFARADKARIKQKEFEFAAGHLGGRVAYTGNALPRAHAEHAITGGHFMRRLQILKETLVAHQVPQVIIDHWLGHTEAMRPFITQHSGSDCDDGPQAPSHSTRPPPAEAPLPVSRAAGADVTKPMPSMEEINAYLERSAALTKKRLPLAFNSSKKAEEPSASATEAPAPPAQASASRALPLVGQGKPKA
jgi:hemoglobin